MKKIFVYACILIVGLFGLTSCSKDAALINPNGFSMKAYLSQTAANPNGNMDIYDVVLTSDYQVGPANVEIIYFAQPFGTRGYYEQQVVSTYIMPGENYFAEIELGEITEVYVNGERVYDVWQEFAMGGKQTGRMLNKVTADPSKKEIKPIPADFKLPAKSSKFFSNVTNVNEK